MADSSTEKKRTEEYGVRTVKGRWSEWAMDGPSSNPAREATMSEKHRTAATMLLSQTIWRLVQQSTSQYDADIDRVAKALASAEATAYARGLADGAERERAANYATERQVRQEMWSFINRHAGESELSAVSTEWLDAWAPELVSGRYADIESGKHLEKSE